MNTKSFRHTNTTAAAASSTSSKQRLECQQVYCFRQSQHKLPPQHCLQCDSLVWCTPYNPCICCFHADNSVASRCACICLPACRFVMCAVPMQVINALYTSGPTAAVMSYPPLVICSTTRPVSKMLPGRSASRTWTSCETWSAPNQDPLPGGDNTTAATKQQPLRLQRCLRLQLPAEQGCSRQRPAPW